MRWTKSSGVHRARGVIGGVIVTVIMTVIVTVSSLQAPVAHLAPRRPAAVVCCCAPCPSAVNASTVPDEC